MGNEDGVGTGSRSRDRLSIGTSNCAKVQHRLQVPVHWSRPEAWSCQGPWQRCNRAANAADLELVGNNNTQ